MKKICNSVSQKTSSNCIKQNYTLVMYYEHCKNIFEEQIKCTLILVFIVFCYLFSHRDRTIAPIGALKCN